MAGVKPEFTVQNELEGEILKKFTDGKTKGEIVKYLVKKGLTKEASIQRVDSVERSPEGRSELARKYRRKMISGFLWVIGSIVSAVPLIYIFIMILPL